MVAKMASTPMSPRKAHDQRLKKMAVTKAQR